MNLLTDFISVNNKIHDSNDLPQWMSFMISVRLSTDLLLGNVLICVYSCASLVN